MQNLVAFFKYFSMLKRCQIAPSGMPATRGYQELRIKAARVGR